MTFKHYTDFSESQVMRSLTRVFQEKGLLKDEPPIQKTAAPQFDLTPSDSLMDNLMKLCSGLRRSGFDKQAEELESKFIQYKRASASLYDVSGEEGKDLVHAAHPKGSHKMEDIDSDEATFEDILDKHLKTLNVVNKQPTGKLASRDLIDAVKVALDDTSFLARKKVAQEAVAPKTEEQLSSAIQKAVSTINYNVSRVDQLTSSELTFSIDPYVEMIAEKLQSPTWDNLNEVKGMLSKLETRLDPKSWLHYMTGSGLSVDTWNGIQDLLKSSIEAITNAMNWRSQLKQLMSKQEINEDKRVKEPATPAPTSASEQLMDKYKSLVQSIERDIERVQSKRLPNNDALVAWLKKAKDEFANKYLTEYSSKTYKDDPGVISGYSAQYDMLKSKIDAFEEKWLSA